MRYPPRLAHLATQKVVIAKLTPTYASAHDIDDEEAAQRLETALKGQLLDDLLASAWESIRSRHPRLGEQELLDKVAAALRDRPQRPGRMAKMGPAWSAFLVLLDLEAGVAGEAARRALDNDQGRKMLSQGMSEAGQHLAAELTRHP